MKKTLIALSSATAMVLLFGAAQAAKHEMPAASGKGQQQKAQNMEKKEVKKQGLSEYFLFTIEGREDIKDKKEVKKQEKATTKEQKAEKKTEKKGNDKAKK